MNIAIVGARVEEQVEAAGAEVTDAAQRAPAGLRRRLLVEAARPRLPADRSSSSRNAAPEMVTPSSSPQRRHPASRSGQELHRGPEHRRHRYYGRRVRRHVQGLFMRKGDGRARSNVTLLIRHRDRRHS